MLNLVDILEIPLGFDLHANRAQAYMREFNSMKFIFVMVKFGGEIILWRRGIGYKLPMEVLNPVNLYN